MQRGSGEIAGHILCNKKENECSSKFICIKFRDYHLVTSHLSIDSNSERRSGLHLKYTG